mmetsp:Transcript_27812/g.56895  ORF Transcript_27812/g.56895 Transcript_27812/m.56895 type:complete len:266 (+) Transcript_27812:294-1091(+)
MTMALFSADIVQQWHHLMTRESSAAYAHHNNLPYDISDESNPSEYDLLRGKLSMWIYDVIDHYGIDRNTAGISLALFDLYLSKRCVASEEEYQLVAMTCLYIAIKMHSHKKIPISAMSRLSKGHFESGRISKMEINIIKSLNWYLNPPTAAMFVDITAPLLQEFVTVIDTCGEKGNPSPNHIDINGCMSLEAMELARYLVELSTCDPYFTRMRPSSIAVAAIRLSKELLATEKTQRACFYDLLEYSSREVDESITRLRELYNTQK